MSDVNLLTVATNFFRFRSTNATDASFPSRVPTLTAPSGAGNNVAQATASAVRILRDADCPTGLVSNRMLLMPFGAGSNNNTMSVRLYAWNYFIDAGDAVQALWIPTLLCELACTLSSSVTGAANGTLGTSQLFADTLVLTYGNDDVSIDIVSPANDLPAHAVVDIKGAQRVELTTTTGSSATSCNALGRMY